jgi:cell wall-associated NlpC family hydrolase
MWKAFSSAVASPMGRFFTATVPGWFAQVASFFSGSWNKSWAWFGSVIGGGFNRFWTKTIPGWFNQVTSFFTGSWGRSWSWFNGNIIGGFSRFFGSTIPSWITGMEHGFTRAWDNIWSAFQGAGKNAVNWVITHVINHGVIDLINSITGVFGIPKIQYVGTVAAGGDIGAAPGRFVRMAAGSVPGTGDEDGTPIIAMGGEWMLRKPARMALQSQFGPDFLPFLNQADTWLGAGSRGSAATQRPRSNSLPFPARPYASGGQIASEAERFIGAPYVYGGTSPAGWDCSGFVQYVLSQLGWHNVPRTSEAQYGWAHHTANPAVGGLVFAQFPGDNAPPGHVGFYVGSGNVLSARDPALGTGIDRLSSWGGHIVGYGDEPNATGLIGQVVGALGSFVSATVGSIEGLLSGDGSALAAGVSGVARFIGGGAGSLLKLAERGARALFDAGWDHTIGPLVGQVPPGTIEGSSVRYAADTIKKGVDHFLGAKDSAAQQAAAASGGVGGAGAIGPVVGPADQGPAQAMNYAVGKLGAYGWGGGQFPPLRSLWNQESGWNRLARNPSSGAYGIPQSLPASKLPAAGQAGGGSHASPQIDWGLNYIKTTPGYGSPAAAWAHEQAHNWYPSGGAVGEVPVPYLAGFHTGQAHNVLVAAGLRPTAAPGQKASWWTTGTDPRATTHVPPHSAVSIHAHKSSSREGIRVPDLAGYTAGMAHNILVAEGLVPVADRGQRATWMVTGSSPPKGAGTKAGAHVRIIAPAPKTPPPPGTPAPRGGDAGQNWTYYSGQLARAKADETSALWAYVGAHLPKLTVPQWEGDYSDRLILAWQQQNLYSAYNKVAAGLHDPVSMTAAQWTGLQHQAALQKNWIYGDTPPRSVWGAEKTGAGGLSANWPKGYKPGTYTPSGWARWKYAHGAWAAANAKAKALDSTIGGAYKAWNALYGPGGPLSTGVIFGGGTPGITVLPSGGPSTPPITVDLEPLIGGGPAHPVVTTGPSLSGTGSGFAMGGPVGGDGASLGQVAGMFAMGGLVPSDGLPAMGLPPQLARQLSASTADQGTPRTMSAAGDRIGVSVGNLTIHNPLPEKPSDSIVRSSNRLAFLGGR